MSDNYDDSEENIRKVLRELPRVKAKPDFEQRLARKLAEPASPPSGMFAWLNISRRIPVPAYSAAALVILAIVSYYAFFRSGALPTPPVTTDEISSKPAPPPDNTPGPVGKDELSAAAKGDDQKQNTQVPAGDQKRTETPREELAKAPAPSVQRKTTSSEPVQRQQSVVSDQERGLTQQAAEGVSKSRLKKEEKEGAAEESVRLQEAPATAPPINFAPGQKSLTPQAQVRSAQPSPYSVSSETFRAVLDSVHIKDSLRADSLRKARLDSLKKK